MVQVSRWPSAEGSDTLCGSRHAQLCISAARQQTDNITVAPNREYLKISEELISARSQARPKQMNKQNQNTNLVSETTTTHPQTNSCSKTGSIYGSSSDTCGQHISSEKDTDQEISRQDDR